MLLLPGSLRGTLKLDKFEAERALLGWPFVQVGVMTHICYQKSVTVCVYGINLPYWVVGDDNSVAVSDKV